MRAVVAYESFQHLYYPFQLCCVEAFFLCAEYIGVGRICRSSSISASDASAARLSGGNAQMCFSHYIIAKNGVFFNRRDVFY